MPLIVDNTVATPTCARSRWETLTSSFSATKYLGHFWLAPRCGRDRRLEQLRLRLPARSASPSTTRRTGPTTASSTPATWAWALGATWFCCASGAHQPRPGRSHLPTSTFLISRGIETLSLRVERHVFQRAGGRPLPREGLPDVGNPSATCCGPGVLPTASWARSTRRWARAPCSPSSLRAGTRPAGFHGRH